jgi:4-diphosphocytidyl-2-C-methyl-D-erythritol kinase
MSSITLKAPAKLNLYLNILGKRSDGYHELETVFERISLHDTLNLTLRQGRGIDLSCTDPTLEGADNLCWCAADLFLKTFGIDKRVEIRLEKRIPKGGGLGGASTDAASVLLGLNRLSGMPADQETLYKLGAQLGSDVNFFLSGSRFALARGRGEQIVPIVSSLKLYHLLLMGYEEISTAAVYKAYKGRLTKHLDSVKLIVHSLTADKPSFPEGLLFNALTQAYLAVSRKGNAIFSALVESGETFLLSGSGATINVIVDSPKRELACSVKRRLSEKGVTIMGASSD